MLATFHASVAASAPSELNSSSSHGLQGASDKKSGLEMVRSMSSHFPDVLEVLLPKAGMAYTHHNQPLLMPRSFASVDGIYCLFEGALENLPTLRQEYGLAKHITDVMLVIEAYRTLRDRGPFPPHKVVKDFEGRFVFILFDSNKNDVFVARDKEGKVPFYWGTAADGCLTFSDTADTLKSGCGKSFAPFPPGCFFSSHVGIQSFEYPLQKIEAVPRVDSQGQLVAAEFKVDMKQMDVERKESMHRIGSQANWTESL